jgi:hypothetical protein
VAKKRVAKIRAAKKRVAKAPASEKPLLAAGVNWLKTGPQKPAEAINCRAAQLSLTAF